MSIANSWNFIRTLFDWDKFAKVTHNQYRVVSSRPYKQVITQMYYSGSRLQLFLVEYSQEQV